MKNKLSILGFLLWAISHMNFTTVKYIGVGAAGLIASESKAQTGGVNTFRSGPYYYWYIINGSLNPLTGAEVIMRMSKDTMWLHQKHFLFDSIASYPTAITGSNAVIYIGANGKIASATYSTLTLPLSSITGTSSLQTLINGTGFVKSIGTVISFDNSTYLTAEVDGSISNEIQNLSLNGQTVSISGGNSIVIPTQTTALTASQVTTALTYIPLSVEVDGSITNEIQTLSGSGTQTIALNSGGTFIIPTQTVATTITSSTGISVGGSHPNYTVTNTIPDKTVAIAGTGINVTSAYPSFSLTMPARSYAVVTRSLNTVFQISTTNDYGVNYSINIAITSILLGTNTGSVALQICQTSGGTYTTVAQSNVSIGGVASTFGNTQTIGAFIPAGYFIKLTTAMSGANGATFTFQYGQENSY